MSFNQTALFEEAKRTVANVEKAAKEGDAEAIAVKKLLDDASLAVLFADLRKWRTPSV